jgi:hypothetical protein
MQDILYNLTTREYQTGDAINQQLKNIDANFKEINSTVVSVSEMPTASEALRGKMYILQGATEEQDARYICLKTEADEYAWAEIPVNFA